MTEKQEPSVAQQMVRLFTHFPCAGTNDANFEAILPPELSKASYDIVVKHIEFRRRCMNQGFDNLLELLKMHYDTLTDRSACERDTKEPTTGS